MSKIIEGLNRLTADSMALYQKLHHYHWNVTGEDFFALHAKFEELYNYFSVVLDDSAERVLTLGGTPPRTLGEVLETTQIHEDGGLPEPQDMVKAIIADFHKVLESTLPIAEAADEARDRATAAMLDDLRVRLEKEIWLLSAYIK